MDGLMKHNFIRCLVFLIYKLYSYILDLGEGVHRRSVERDLIERQAAVHTAEQAVWAQAEIDKEAAIKKLFTKLEAEHEKRVKRLLKTHKEALKVIMLWHVHLKNRHMQS